MKLRKPSQLILVSMIGLLAATFLTACQIITVDYIFVAGAEGSGNSTGVIDVFAADSESGALRTAISPVPSGGIAPVALAVTSNYENLYVANQVSNNIVHFSIATNGELTKMDAVALGPQGSSPASIAVNSAGTRLYVVSNNHPGTGGTVAGAVLAVFPLSSTGAIGTAIANGGTEYWPLVVPGFESDLIVPTGVIVTANNDAVYVTAYDESAYNPGGTTTSTANPGWVFGFRAGSGSSVAAAAGSPFKAGVKPTAASADPTNRFVYVADYASNELIGYTIQSGYELEFMINGPFKTGNEPQAVTIDPRGKYIYVANALDSSVSAYAIDLSTGTPSAAINPTGSATNNTDTEPVAIVVDAALGRFVYTANHLGNSVSGFELNPNTGNLSTTQSTPYPASDNPTAIVTVPHGSHSLESVTP
jgi:6-phosphogluconolactonase